MTRKTGDLNYEKRILAKILNEKVVTESDLLKILGCRGSHAIEILDMTYKNFVKWGYPIRKKYLEGNVHARCNHRVVIYYIV
jgi:hypothetical protein